MVNIFYGYGIIWALILILYLLGWSDLCFELDTFLIVFILFSIIVSFCVGFLMRKKLKFIKLTDNPHKKSTITKVLILLYILEILYERKIPLLNVFRGMSYAQTDFSGIPSLHLLISSFSIFYSFYLAYIYVCFKEKRVLCEYLIIVSFFIILMQRQNILICLLIFINIIYASNSETIAKKLKNIKVKFLTVVLCILLLFAFGVFGNIRYGSTWEWNDSSMICELGKMNSKYPSILPKEYFWSYIYLISPLVNLNYNVIKINNVDDTYSFIMEFTPEFIRNKVFDYKKIKVVLPVSSLTASTSYSRVHNTLGYAGMYFMFLFQIIVCVIIINCSYRNKKKYFIVVCNALAYFLLFTFFTNTVVYSITSMLVIFSILCSTRLTFRKTKYEKVFGKENDISL